MDARGAKIFEIYSSGKSGFGNAPGNASSHIGSNISTGSGGHSGITTSTVLQPHTNSFLQNKYQFATYYGQKNYPAAMPQHITQNHMVLNPHHQYNGSLSNQSGPGNSMPINLANNSSGMSNGILSGSQYEYPIEGAVEQRQGSQTGIVKGGSISNKAGTSSQTASSSLPKRTPHSELTSYQSEKRLKEYKQQQAMQQVATTNQYNHPAPANAAVPVQTMNPINAINANSRQQFIIEEEGAYSQRSSDDETDQKQKGRGSIGISNNFNTNS